MNKQKYVDLVWAVKKPPLDADAEVWEEYWSNKDQPVYTGRQPTPFEIIPEGLKNLRRIAETYPEEYAELKGEQGDYFHGFNSGCLETIEWFEESLTIDGGIDHE